MRLWGNKRLLLFGGILAIIAVNIIFYYYKEWPYNSPQDHTPKVTPSIRPKRDVTPKPSDNSLCGKTKGLTTIPSFCIPSGGTALITIPLHTLTTPGILGKKGTDYKNYPYWYITNDPKDTSWSTLVAEIGYDWKKYTTSVTAKHLRPLIKFGKTNDKLLLNVNLTGSGILPPGYVPPTERSGDHGQNCTLLLIWVYTKGKDVHFPIKLCEESRNVTPAPTQNRLAQNRGSDITDDPSVDDYFEMTTGIGASTNNWLLLTEQTGQSVQKDCVVCMGPRPILKIVPTPSELNATCLISLLSKQNPDPDCLSWEKPFPMADNRATPPFFDSKVAPNNFTCFTNNGSGRKQMGSIKSKYCSSIQNFTRPSQARADIWWWCGGKSLSSILPKRWTGRCAPVTLLMPVTIIVDGLSEEQYSSTLNNHVQKRELSLIEEKDPVYIDAIGVPRGVPDEYKLVNQIAAGWESSLCPWCTINKNVDRINYIHYNVQKLSNFTRDGFEAVHEQLKATSLMAFQNRVAVDMLLAERGGVCSIFGDQCCTFIPNNTNAGGKLTRAVEGLRTLSNRLKEQSGVDTSMWDKLLENMFGKWKGFALSIMIAFALFTSLLVLCGCCCIPCIRSLMEKCIERAVGNNLQGQYLMLSQIEPPEGELQRS